MHDVSWCARTISLALGLCAASCAVGPDRSASDSDPSASSAMTEPVQHVHHAINYIEFTVTDMAESQRFYREAFGWKFTDYGPEYAGIQAGPGRESGGFRLDAEVTRGGPLVVLYSDDLDASVVAVREAGGEIVVEPLDFPGGRRFHFLDPSGNELAVWGAPAE